MKDLKVNNMVKEIQIEEILDESEAKKRFQGLSPNFSSTFYVFLSTAPIVENSHIQARMYCILPKNVLK